MGWRSPSRIIIVVVVGVVLVVAAATSLLIRYELMPNSDAGSLHPSTLNGTQVMMVVAVDANGRPINGYRELPAPPDPGSLAVVSGCIVSPASVSGDVYHCVPNVAAADVCWPSAPGSLLCLNDPWDKGLHRVNYTEPLPHVQPPATPEPFALLLEDGTQCRLRNGGAWGGRDDGLVGAYGCANTNLVVLVAAPSDVGVSAIDRSQPMWTVKIGPLGAGEPRLPPPQARSVKTAWFAGS